MRVKLSEAVKRWLLPSVSEVPLGKLPGEEGVQASMAKVGAATPKKKKKIRRTTKGEGNAKD
jgi:hypothetical protein